jgi:putative restriction endonuclease
MPATLTRYLHAFRSLNVNRTGGRASPHKPCMLLAVLGLAEAGDLQRNEIRFDPALLERYAKFFAAVQGDTDHPNPYFPFFHLKSEGFWHLQPLPSREAVAGAMSSARSAAAITANIAWATLDADLHALAQDEPSRTALRETLLVAWFADRRSRLLPVLADERGSDRYPLRHSTWEALHERKRDRARAELFHGKRCIRLELRGLPFGGQQRNS